ncbi:uncharacterized protein LOC135372802 isoform X3 [Ornithodoros turicata]|uniref:uncharacterized protein LOC135372802 isoform X3 n=1 Tax=Ornithodoros turicata TaxID=34597 RepID=UPI00313A25FF
MDSFSTMDQRHFFIVKFPGEDNDVDVVHSTWVEDGHCWWPPERNSNKLRSMIVRGHAPLQSWNKVECSVIERFCPSEDYSEECTVLSQDISHGYQASGNYARHGLVLQEHASSQQLGQHAGGFQQGAASSPWSPFLGEGRGYVGENNSIGPQSQLYSRDTTADMHARDSRVVYGAPFSGYQSPTSDTSNARRFCPVSNITPMVHREEMRKSQPRLQPRALIQHSYSTSTARGTTLQTGFENEVLRLLHAIKIAQEDQTSQLNTVTSALERQTVQAALDEYNALEPYEELDQFLAIDRSLKDEKEMKKLLTMLQQYGGTNTKDATLRLLRALMTDDVATAFSWKGGKGKIKFCDLLCCDAVFRCIKSNRLLKNTTDSEIECHIKSWLRHAKERIDRKAANKERPSASQV